MKEVDMLDFEEIVLKNIEFRADPQNEPKTTKPATRAGFKPNYLRTGRDSNPRPPP